MSVYNVDTIEQRDDLVDIAGGNPGNIEVYVRDTTTFYKWIDGAYRATSVPFPLPAMAGNENKLLKYKADGTGFEAVAATGTGDLLSTNNLSDLDDPEEAIENLGIPDLLDEKEDVGVAATLAAAALSDANDYTDTVAADKVDKVAGKALSENDYADSDKAKVDFITVTQAVNLDTLEARVNFLDAVVILKDTFDPTGGFLPGGGTAQAGWSYIVTADGTIDGVALKSGDRIIAIVDNASETVFAANWFLADYTDTVLSINGQTGAVTLTTANVADSTNKRYCTDAEKTVIGNTSGTNSGNETAATVGTIINGTSEKLSVANDDLFSILDSAASNVLKKLKWSTIVTALNSLYQAVLVSGTNIKSINGSSILGAGNLTVSASITQTEVDFGATPVADKLFTVSDAAAIVGSKIVAQVAYDAPTGKDLDEVEADDLIIRCGNATTGFFEMFIRAADGSYLHDKFKINYIIS